MKYKAKIQIKVERTKIASSKVLLIGATVMQRMKIMLKPMIQDTTESPFRVDA